MSQPRQWFRLHWPRELSSTEALQLVLSLHGAAHQVVLELRGTGDQVEHLVGVADVSARALTERLRSSMPSVVLEPVERVVAPPLFVWRLVRRDVFPFSIDRSETVVRAVLAAVAAVRPGETLVLQWVLGRALAPALVPEHSMTSPGDTWTRALFKAPFHGAEPMPATQRTRLQTKWAMPGWRLTGRIGVVTGSPSRSRQLAYALLSALRLAEGPGAHLQLRRTTRQSLVSAGMSPIATGSVNAAELVALAGLPLGDIAPANLVRQRQRLLMPGSHMPSIGVALATSPTGAELRLPETLAREHLAIISPTGGGKSTACLSMIEQYLSANHGLVLCDPKGDLASAALEHVPAHRKNDIVVLDPLDPEAVVGLNPLAGKESPDLITDGLLAIFRGLYGDNLGPRSEDILHAALLTLCHAGNQTLVSLPLLLTDPNFRRRLVSKVAHEPVLAHFWAWFDALSESERSAMVAAPLNKLRPFLYSRGLRRVLGQPRPRFSVDSLFTERKVLIVSLARGQLGDASAMLGALLVNQLWRTIERQVSVPPERRPTVPIILDEIGDYLRLPLDLGEALAKARGYGAAFTLVAQSLQLLPPSLRSAMLANARNKLLFTLGPDDARLMANASGGQLDATDFLRLPRYDVYLELSGLGWYSGRTAAPTSPTSKANEIRALSRARFGTPVTDIEAALEQQLGSGGRRDDAPPLGRRSRS